MVVNMILKSHPKQKQKNIILVQDMKFDSIENKHDIYRREGYMKKFRDSLKHQKMTLTNKQKESYGKMKFATFAKSNCT